MSDLIEKLLEVEREARRIIASAEREAQEILEAARQEAARIRDEARDRAHQEARELQRSRLQALEEEKQRLLQQESAHFPSPDRMAPEHLERAVRFAVQVIAGQDVSAP